MLRIAVGGDSAGQVSRLGDAVRPLADDHRCRLPGRLLTNMKSPEVYAAIRDGLGPSLKSLGFRREKAFLSWSREHKGQQTVVWCQVSRDGWDAYAGSKFVVELQRSDSAQPGAPSSARARLAKFLSDDQRSEAWRIQSQVIASLSRPPPTHPVLQVSPDVARWYLEKFEPLRGAYGPNDDLWLRYAQAAHVDTWADFLRQVAPGCVKAARDDWRRQPLAMFRTPDGDLL